MENKKKKILVAIDYSQQSIDAAAYISDILHPRKNTITLFHLEKDHFNIIFNDEDRQTKDLAGQTDFSKWMTIQKHSIDANLKKAEQLFIDKAFPIENIRTIKQSPTKDITRDLLAESRKSYDLIVTGKSKLNRISKDINGTVTEKLLHQTFHIPLVVVSGAPDTRKVLVGYDFSRGSEKAVNVSARLIRKDLEEVLLCHILCDFLPPLIQPINKIYGLNNNAIPDLEDHFSRAHLRKIESRLTKASEFFISEGFLSSSVRRMMHYRITSRSQSLIDVAAAQGCGSLILGRRGHFPVGEFLIGRVGQKAIETSGTRAIWII